MASDAADHVRQVVRLWLDGRLVAAGLDERSVPGTVARYSRAVSRLSGDIRVSPLQRGTLFRSSGCANVGTLTENSMTTLKMVFDRCLRGLCSVAAEELDDAKPTPGTDVDGDGVLAADDCDDTDANSTTIADADCDGVLTEDDCDDHDDLSTIIAEDADCDGVLTADDCDDEDAMVVDTCVFGLGDFMVDDEDTIADVEAVRYCHTIEGEGYPACDLSELKRL